jgi:hypothetical protein
MKLAWRKHACSGVVAIMPKEFGGGSAHIVPHAFGSTKARLRLHDNPHARHFFFNQFYANAAAAKAALVAHLTGCHDAAAQRQRCELAP